MGKHIQLIQFHHDPTRWHVTDLVDLRRVPRTRIVTYFSFCGQRLPAKQVEDYSRERKFIGKQMCGKCAEEFLLAEKVLIQKKMI